MLKLSIIIPVYNVERYVAKCLNSVKLAIEDCTDVEVIVVDDGSPDHSIEVAQPILDTMPYSTLIRQKNQGLSGARNAGLDEARGEYVWFVDSDDWLLPNAINDVLSVLQANDSLDVIASILQMNYEGKRCCVKNEYQPEICKLNGKDYLRRRYPQGASQRFILRKAFLRENDLKFRKDLLHEDGLFGYTMLYFAKKVFILSKPVYAYRLRQSGSIMSCNTMRTPESLLLIHKLLMEFRQEKVAEEDRMWYREEIFKVIADLFVFSKKMAFKKDFASFYRENRSYFNGEAAFVLHQGKMTSKARMVRYYPLLLMRIKYLGRKIIDLFTQ